MIHQSHRLLIKMRNLRKAPLKRELFIQNKKKQNQKETATSGIHQPLAFGEYV